MRGRDLSRFEATEFDLLVVGGGIHGLACAYDAASRGLRVALAEAGDFGGGASFNHQKTAHGGLRSLGSAQVQRARESIYERRALARIAPWFLRPLPFLLGTYRSFVKNRVALAGAFRFDAWLGRHRNDGVEPELHLPAGRLVSKAATLKLFAGIRQDGLTGGAQWYDYQMVESDRLTFAFAAAADRAGAELANHVIAVDVLKEGTRVAGMRLRDAIDGSAIEVRARLTLNAAGSRAGEVMTMFGVPTRPFPLVKAMNLVTSKPASDMALAAPAPGGRMLTLVPWRGCALVGTGQSARFVEPGDTGVSSIEMAALIADADYAFPALHLTPADVTLVHRGIVPAITTRHNLPDLKPTPDIIDHSADGIAGAVTVVGVKYTTARGVAERVTNVVAARIGKRVPSSRTATTTLPGAGIADHEALAIEAARHLHLDLPLRTIRHLTSLYAEAAPQIIRLMTERPELGGSVAAGVETLGVEVLHVIRNEMALRLPDIVLRRTMLGAGARPSDDALAAISRIAAAELGWDAARTAGEIAAVQQVYYVPVPRGSGDRETLEHPRQTGSDADAGVR
jgi:glycerol-3-phosphate dehydrogenase